MSQFEIYFTTPYKITWTDDDPPVMIADTDHPAQLLGRAWQFSNANLDAPWGALPRQFDFTMSVYDSVFEIVKATKEDGVTAYNTFVYVEWRGHPVMWGPLTDPEWKMKDGIVNFRCYSQLKRWEAHFLRNGDVLVDAGPSTVDYRSVLLLRDAAEVSNPFVYRPVGIKEGDNDASTVTQTMKFERGQQVLRAADDLLKSSYAPEIVETTLKFNEDPPYYAQLDMSDPLQLGTDRFNQVILQGGYGIDNLDDVTYTPGGKIITHAVVLDRGGKHREIRTDDASAEDNGVWVDWNAVDFEVTSALSDEVLGTIAQTEVDLYSRPPKFAQLFLKKDDELFGSNQYYWLEDFFHGDFIRASVKKGAMSLPDTSYRIVGVGLKQEDQDTGVRQSISVVPRATDTETSENYD